MLEIFLRENHGVMAKDRYVFRSRNMATFTQDELIKKMAAFNTTITEADTLAVLDVLKSLVLEYTEQGYTVQTPLGLFYASASGSTDDILGDFSPETSDTNHKIRLLYRPNTEIIDGILKNTPTTRVSNMLKTQTHIDMVKNADSGKTTQIKGGDMIMVCGDNLKFDTSDSAQGIFLENDAAPLRLSYYTRNTAGILEARIDPSVAAGDYKLIVRNCPVKQLMETVYKDPITISD